MASRVATVLGSGVCLSMLWYGGVKLKSRGKEMVQQSDVHSEHTVRREWHIETSGKVGGVTSNKQNFTSFCPGFGLVWFNVKACFNIPSESYVPLLRM